jgi:hypothetical protein
MNDRTMRHNNPPPGSNPTIGSQKNNKTCKSIEKHGKKQKRNGFEHSTDLLHIITLNVREFKTSEKMKQLEYATDL